MRTSIYFIFLLIVGFTFSQKMTITSSSKKALKLYNEGMVYLNNLQNEKADKLFKKALKLDPHFIMAKFRRSNAQRAFKKRQEIRSEVFHDLKSAKISDAERLFLERSRAFANNDTKLANEKLFKLHHILPNDPLVNAMMAGYHRGQNDKENQIKYLKRSLEIDPRQSGIYISLGYIYKDSGHYHEAEDYFAKGVKYGEKNPNAYDSYGEFLLKSGKYKESIENYEKALKIEKLFPSAVMGIASNLLHMGKHREARKRLDQIMHIAPSDVVRGGVCWAKSITYLDESDYKNALYELEQNLNYSAKQHDKISMTVDLSNIVKVLYEMKDYELAEKKIAEMHRLRMETAKNDQQKVFAAMNKAFNYTYLELNKGNIHSAEKHAKKFAELAKPLDNFFINRNSYELFGAIELAKGNYEKALEKLNKANRTTAANMYRIARCYEKLGNEKKAKEMYGYVTTYRGSLNLDYSLYRHKAAEKIQAL